MGRAGFTGVHKGAVEHECPVGAMGAELGAVDRYRSIVAQGVRVRAVDRYRSMVTQGNVEASPKPSTMTCEMKQEDIRELMAGETARSDLEGHGQEEIRQCQPMRGALRLPKADSAAAEGVCPPWLMRQRGVVTIY